MFPSPTISSRLRTWATTAVDVADAILTAQPPAEPGETPDLHAAVHRGSRTTAVPARRPRRPAPASAPVACTSPVLPFESRTLSGTGRPRPGSSTPAAAHR